MPESRSDRACQLCRQRRVKCDKTLPTCIRCRNFSRECPGYPKGRKFIDQSRKYAGVDWTSPASSVPCPIATSKTAETGSLPSIAENSQNRHSNGAFVATATSQAYNSSAIFVSSESPCFPSSRNSNASHQEEEDLAYFDLDIDTYYSNGNNHCGFFPESVDSEFEPITETLNEYISEEEQEDLKEDFTPLMRLFVEILAPWMDMFDINAYFSHAVPHYAALDLLLQSALAAVASKQAARYLASRTDVFSIKHIDQILAPYTEKSPNEWFYRAAKYYDQGISKLRVILNQILVTSDTPSQISDVFDKEVASTNDVSVALSTSCSTPPAKQCGSGRNVFSAISIFSFYESLDDCLTRPSQHISGFKALLRCAHTAPCTLRMSRPITFDVQSAGRAAFWYFARKEVFAAYVHHVRPAFDPNSPPLWTAAGLPESICTSFNTASFGSQLSTLASSATEEDPMIMIYTLIWLSTLVVKFIADLEDESETDIMRIGSPSVLNTPQGNYPNTTSSKSSYWSMLRDHLYQWYNYRPQIFRPYASNDSAPTTMPKMTLRRTVWFACSMGAAAAQLYHFIQMLLLLNRPFESSKAMRQPNRLQLMKKDTEEIEHHSREICAIASGASPSTIQRQMSQPLQLAGACFDAAADRNVILQLLNKSASETCSAPEDMTQNLLAQWKQSDESRRGSQRIP